MLVYIVLIVALLCFILYVIDRRMRSEPIDWMTALKVTSVGALLSGGTGYALSSEDVSQVVEKVVEVVKEVPVPVSEAAQEMFVGVPTF
jgi:dihydrodipicolinate synthase/N-acetylneuraminate lyase